MGNIFLIMFAAILTENFIFSRFLGICPFLGVSNKPSTAFGMGMAVTFVMTVSSAATWAVYHLILEVHDSGPHHWVAYKRVIIDVD